MNVCMYVCNTVTVVVTIAVAVAVTVTVTAVTVAAMVAVAVTDDCVRYPECKQALSLSLVSELV